MAAGDSQAAAAFVRRYQARVFGLALTTDGVRYPAGTCRVTDQSATVGYALPVPVSAIGLIELSHPGARLTALPT